MEQNGSNGRLNDYLDLDTALFLSQTKTITKLGLSLGSEYGLDLGGRDCLILANFLSNSMGRMATFDRALLNLGELSIDEQVIRIILPTDV